MLYCADPHKNGVYEIKDDQGKLWRKETYNEGRLIHMEHYYENGQMRHRYNLQSGKKEGLYEEWYENGQLRTRCYYKNNLQHGLYEIWHSNGQISFQCNYIEGQKAGLMTEWNDRGYITQKQYYPHINQSDI